MNFAKENLFISRFRRSTAACTQERKKWQRSIAASFHIAQLILNAYSIAALLIVAAVVSDGRLGIGDYIAVLGILFNFTDNLPYTSHYLQRFKAARENLNYINETIAYEEQASPLTLFARIAWKASHFDRVLPSPIRIATGRF